MDEVLWIQLLQAFRNLFLYEGRDDMRKQWCSALLLSSVFCMAIPSVVAQDFSHDMKKAGQSTKDAAKDTGHAVEHGTKKGWHATKHGTKKAAHATKRTTKKAAHATAHKTDEGARKVEHKTNPNP